MKKKKVFKRAISIILSASMLVSATLPVVGKENNNAQQQKSIWESDWKAGDPTTTGNKYQLYPVPQSITYPNGSEFTLSKDVNVVYGTNIDDATKTYLNEILTEYGHTSKETNKAGNGNDIILGIKGSDDEADKWFKDKNLDANLFEKSDAYALYVKDGDIVILGKDSTAVFYGLSTLRMMFSSFAGKKFVPVEISDYASIEARGFIEGFYGAWTHNQRKSLMEFSKDVKLNLYVYAAKTDPYHTSKWDQLYPQGQIDEFKELVQLQNENKCEFSWSVHLTDVLKGITSADAEYERRKQKLMDKFDQLYDIGVRRFCILNDDFGAGSNEMVVKLVNDLNKEYIKPKKCEPIIYCPKGYNNAWANQAELDSMKQFDQDILIFWTGKDVNSPFEQESISFVKEKTGHDPVFWVNYPCNEHAKSGIFLGSSEYYLRDNITGLAGAVSNPIFFAEADKVALFQLGAYFWNVNNYSKHTDEVWEQCFKYLQPEVYDEYFTIAKNVSNAPDSGRVPQGFEESKYLKEHLESVEQKVKDDTLTENDQQMTELISEFQHIQTAVTDFMANCENKDLVQELSNPGNTDGGEGWLQSLSNVAKAGEEILKAEKEMAKQNPDTATVWESFATASSEMSKYKKRTYQFPDGANKPNAKAGSKRLVPFIEECMKDVQGFMDGFLANDNSETPADRIYTNLSKYAKTPLTIDGKELGIRNIGQVTLNKGEYIGIKKKDIADISKVILEGENINGLTLQYSFYGDEWKEVEAGDLTNRIQARYLRIVNNSDTPVTFTLNKLAMVVENLSYKITLQDTNIDSVQDGVWENMFDGKKETYVWTGRGQKTGDYITIDLGTTKPINDIKYLTADGNPRIYKAKVSISKDNKEFTEVGTFSNNGTVNPPYREYTLNANGQEGRYIKLEVTENSGWYLKLHEIIVNENEQNPDIVNSNPIITNTTGDVTAINDKDLSSVFQVENTKNSEYLDYRITDNVNVQEFTILQGGTGDVSVKVIKSDGTTQDLGKLNQTTQTFNGFDSPIHSIRLEFGKDANVKINEILVKHGEDSSKDVGEAVDNIDVSDIPQDSTAKVNLALKQPVEVSGVETNNVKPESAVDGDINTKWDSAALKGNNAKSPQWIVVDLGEYTNIIEKFTMRYYNKVYPTDYDVKVSNDKENWVTLKTITKENNGPSNPVDEVSLDTPVMARYVKLEFRAINSAAAGNSIGLQELEVNGVRRHAQMNYTGVTNPENVKVEIGAQVELPQLVTASIKAQGDESETSVDVMPKWTPNTVDTSAEKVEKVIGELPLTHTLSNVQGQKAEFTVTVGDGGAELDKINLAKGKEVTVSDVEMKHDGETSTGHIGSNAVDENENTRWSSGPLNEKSAGTPADQWIVVDLGENISLIDEIKVDFYNKVWPTEYHIEVSNDNENWARLDTITHQSSNDQNISDSKKFETPLMAQYVRLYFPKGKLNENAAGGSVSIKELTVMGASVSQAMNYTEVTSNFEPIEVDNTATAETLNLPKLVNVSLTANSKSPLSIAPQVIPNWNTEGFNEAVDKEITITGTLPTGKYVTNGENLTAQQIVIKGNPDNISTIKEELQRVIEEAEKITDTSIYTDESVKVFTDALANAKKAMDSQDAKEIENATNALRTAIDNLELKPTAPDTSKLDENISIALDKLNQAKNNILLYDNDTVVALQSVYEKALQVKDNPQSQEEVDNAVNELVNAINGLKVLSLNALQENLNKAKGIDKSLYTAESVNVLNQAIEKADALLKSPVTQKQVDDMTAELQNAINGLKETTVPTNPENPTKPENPANSGNDNSPIAQTNDNNIIDILFIIMLCSVGAVFIIKRNKKAKF